MFDYVSENKKIVFLFLSPGQTIETFQRNITATLLDAKCCVRLATMLRLVAMCCDMHVESSWLKFETGQIVDTEFVDVA